MLRGADGSKLVLELYDQRDLGGSLGIFSAHRPEGKAIQERDGVSFFTTSVDIIGRTGKYFFRAADRTSPLGTAKSLALVGTLGLLRARTPLPEASAAPAAEIPTEMRILMDALALQESDITFEAANAFQSDFASNFWFGSIGKADARACPYRRNTRSRTYAVRSNSDSQALLEHKFLKTLFVLAMHRRFIYGLTNLAATTEIKPMLDKLAQALQA